MMATLDEKGLMNEMGCCCCSTHNDDTQKMIKSSIGRRLPRPPPPPPVDTADDPRGPVSLLGRAQPAACSSGAACPWVDFVVPGAVS